MQPFKIEIPDDVLIDLKNRLKNSRWPDEISGADWNYGANLSYLKSIVDYWQNTFDWRAQENKLNQFSQYKTDIDGMGIHFIYEHGKGKNPIPLIITHGWPSSFYEMTKIIPMLTDPEKFGGKADDSFDVIVPSLPGYGFSDKPAHSGFNVQKIGDIFAKLMISVLGYQHFAAHGGDWGTSVSARLAYAYPKNVIGFHINSLRGGTPSKPYPGSAPLSDAELKMIDNRKKWLETGGGYWAVQSQTPQTLAYGLNDSPIGLAAWILEKWRAWSDCDGDLEKSFTKDELLVNIMIYWVTQTINSSMRLYYEYTKLPWVLGAHEKINVPCGVASLPGEGCVREWGERFYNIQHWKELNDYLAVFVSYRTPLNFCETTRGYV
jgi:pimeloyl-ACP methyl ester carboxylesterase